MDGVAVTSGLVLCGGSGWVVMVGGLVNGVRVWLLAAVPVPDLFPFVSLLHHLWQEGATVA